MSVNKIAVKILLVKLWSSHPSVLALSSIQIPMFPTSSPFESAQIHVIIKYENKFVIIDIDKTRLCILEIHVKQFVRLKLIGVASPDLILKKISQNPIHYIPLRKSQNVRPLFFQYHVKYLSEHSRKYFETLNYCIVSGKRFGLIDCSQISDRKHHIHCNFTNVSL